MHGKVIRYMYEELVGAGEDMRFEARETTMVEVDFDVHDEEKRQAWARQQLVYEPWEASAEKGHLQLYINLDRNTLGIVRYRGV